MTALRTVRAGSFEHALRDAAANLHFSPRGAEKDTDKQQSGAKVNDSGFRVAPAAYYRAAACRNRFSNRQYAQKDQEGCPASKAGAKSASAASTSARTTGKRFRK